MRREFVFGGCSNHGILQDWALLPGLVWKRSPVEQLLKLWSRTFVGAMQLSRLFYRNGSQIQGRDRKPESLSILLKLGLCVNAGKSYLRVAVLVFGVMRMDA